MENIDPKLVLSSCKFKNAYNTFLLETNENLRNRLFNSVVPTIDKQIAYIFSYLRIRDKDLKVELRQSSIIKIYEKITIEKIGEITNLKGYIRTVIINNIRDYFTLSNIYNKHIREYKSLKDKDLPVRGRSIIMNGEETPQSELIIKPTLK